MESSVYNGTFFTDSVPNVVFPFELRVVFKNFFVLPRPARGPKFFFFFY